jgi:RecJ-like exonuclease
MSDTVRCPSCRGAKKVPKLGGVIGECNTCNGEGKIKACDKVMPIINEPAPELNDLIKATAEALPVAVEPDNAIKVDGKRAIYKRKKSA